MVATADAELVQQVPGLIDDLRLDDAIARLARGLAHSVVVVEGGTTNKSFLLDLLAQAVVEVALVEQAREVVAPRAAWWTWTRARVRMRAASSGSSSTSKDCVTSSSSPRARARSAVRKASADQRSRSSRRACWA